MCTARQPGCGLWELARSPPPQALTGAAARRPGYRPKRRLRSWNARIARRKSILRNAGHNTSEK